MKIFDHENSVNLKGKGVLCGITICIIVCIKPEEIYRMLHSLEDLVRWKLYLGKTEASSVFQGELEGKPGAA